jgi:YHS domain-containing protein
MAIASLEGSRRFIAFGLLFLASVGPAAAGAPIAAVNTEHGLAIKGYDPVTYFRIGKPVRGRADLSATYQGATYLFASSEDRDLFTASPQQFVPQYGGYCAMAIALNSVADIDPEEWAIVGGKLYLNNGFFAQRLWSLDKSGNIVRGDHNWPRMAKSAAPEG